MERTYNVFVDNGLYVLAYYLEKNYISDISEEEVVNSIDMICEKIKEFTDCSQYSNLKSMCFPNSLLTQPNSKEKLNERLKSISKLEGKEYCSCCGKYKANIRNESLHRSYIPNAPANTFYNFSNNLQGINICSTCMILTMYSILNARVNGLVTLYNSESDEFMRSMTYEMQNELIDLEINKSKEKTNNIQSFIKLADELIHNFNTFECSIEQYLFTNAGQGQEIRVNSIASKYIKLVKNLYNNSLWDEFKSLGLVQEVVYNRLENTYINRIIDEKNNKLKCSKELAIFLNEEVNKLDTSTKSIIKELVKKLKKVKFDEKVIKDLKNIKGFTNFENYMREICELYTKETGEVLLNIDEFVEICCPRYRSVINLIIVGLIAL